MPYEDLFNATQASYVAAYAAGLYGYGDYCYMPVVDGTFVQDLPSNQIANGKFSKVPILVDENEFEGSYIFSSRETGAYADIGSQASALQTSL